MPGPDVCERKYREPLLQSVLFPGPDLLRKDPVSTQPVHREIGGEAMPLGRGQESPRVVGGGGGGRRLVIKQLWGELKKSGMYQAQSYPCADGETGGLTHW